MTFILGNYIQFTPQQQSGRVGLVKTFIAHHYQVLYKVVYSCFILFCSYSKIHLMGILEYFILIINQNNAIHLTYFWNVQNFCCKKRKSACSPKALVLH